MLLNFFKGNIHHAAVNAVIAVNSVDGLIKHDSNFAVIDTNIYPVRLDVNQGSVLVFRGHDCGNINHIFGFNNFIRDLRIIIGFSNPENPRVII